MFPACKTTLSKVACTTWKVEHALHSGYTEYCWNWLLGIACRMVCNCPWVSGMYRKRCPCRCDFIEKHEVITRCQIMPGRRIGTLAMFLVAKNFCCFVHQWTAEAHTSLRSATYSGAHLEFTGMLHTRGPNCHRSLKWCFFSLCWRFANFLPCFWFTYTLWRDDLNAQSLELRFSHISVQKPLKKDCSLHGGVTETCCEHLIIFWYSFL